MPAILSRIAVAVLVVCSFGVFAHGIVNAKTLQLRIEVSRKQLLNYRLSSDLLRSRLRLLFQQEHDFSGEIRMSVLESSVMNADLSALPLHVTPFERGGIAATNVVRLMNLKPVLHIDADRRALLLLQYAFFLERKKRYPEAVARYVQVLGLLNDEEDRAFALVHLGYCMTLLGREVEAVAQLEAVTETHRGRHFGEAAKELLAVIRDNQVKQADIRAKHSTPEARAAAYFASGQYRRVLEQLDSTVAPGPSQLLMRARSLEETGQVSAAATAYRALGDSPDPRVRRQAVRRLLLLGEFLSADPEVKRYARQRARHVGEAETLAEIREAKAVVRAPVLLSRLGRTKHSDSTQHGGEAALVDELRTLFPKESFVRALPKVERSGDRVVFAEPPEVRVKSAPEPPADVKPAARPEEVAAKAPGKEPALLPAPSFSIVDSTKRSAKRDGKEQVAVKRASAEPAARKTAEVAPSTKEPAGKRALPAAKTGETTLTPAETSTVAPRIRARARLEVRFLDGRTLPAEEVSLSGGLLRVRLAESTVTLPFSIVSEIRLTPGRTNQKMSVRFPGGARESVTRIRRDGPGAFVLVAPDGAETARVGSPDEITNR